MNRRWLAAPFLVCLVLVVAAGCARTARDTQGFATVERATVGAPFMDTWQAAKTVLRDKGFDLYTRDKRGLFIAYSTMKRRLFVPERIQYTVSLEDITPDTTELTVETVKQVYGVTLLTYYGWHDRKTTDTLVAQSLIEAIQAEVSGESPSAGPSELDAPPAAAASPDAAAPPA